MVPCQIWAFKIEPFGTVDKIPRIRVVIAVASTLECLSLVKHCFTKKNETTFILDKLFIFSRLLYNLKFCFDVDNYSASSEEESRKEAVNINTWLQRKDVVSSYKCNQILRNGFLAPR